MNKVIVIFQKRFGWKPFQDWFGWTVFKPQMGPPVQFNIICELWTTP